MKIIGFNYTKLHAVRPFKIESVSKISANIAFTEIEKENSDMIKLYQMSGFNAGLGLTILKKHYREHDIKQLQRASLSDRPTMKKAAQERRARACLGSILQ